MFDGVLTIALAMMSGAALPVAAPQEAGVDQARLSQIDGLVSEGLAARRMPGCVVLIAHGGRTVFLRAYGRRQVEPTPEPMTTDTIFDLASLTKPIATATSIFQLIERGKLRLDERVGECLPHVTGPAAAITVEQLLLHTSGLIPDNALADYDGSPDAALAKLFAQTPRTPPGSAFKYSDVGFLFLGEIVRKRSGQPLDQFTRENLFGPLGLTDTGYLPPEDRRSRIAPTERRDGQWLRGVVHDPRAARLGGVAGHAGLFGTAEELAVYAQMLLNGGSYGGRTLLQPETIATMTARHAVPSGFRTLGWDSQSGYSTNRGQGFSNRAFGHGGFTGTALWVDPERKLIVIFLSNRLHPDGKGNVNSLAGRIGTVAAEAVDAAR